jgi:hypothetical protein
MPGPGCRPPNPFRTRRWVRTRPRMGRKKSNWLEPTSPVDSGSERSHPTPFLSRTDSSPASIPMPAASKIKVFVGPRRAHNSFCRASNRPARPSFFCFSLALCALSMPLLSVINPVECGRRRRGCRPPGLRQPRFSRPRGASSIRPPAGPRAGKTAQPACCGTASA